MRYSKKLFETFLLSVVMLSGVAHAANEDTRYTFCRSLITENAASWGKSFWVVSSVFRNNLDVLRSDIGIKNSFNSFIEAEFGGHARMALCFHEDSYQDAADERNDLISEYRNGGDDFRTVHWSYRGD